MASIALGDPRRAESLVRQAMALEPLNVTVLKVLAEALYLQKRFSEAKITLQKILTIQSDAVTKGDLATLYRAEHKNEMAMALLQQAVSEITPGQARARLLTNLGVLQWESGMRERSEKTLQDALEEAEASVGSDHPDTARILEQYSEVLRRNGRKAKQRRQRSEPLQYVPRLRLRQTKMALPWIGAIVGSGRFPGMQARECTHDMFERAAAGANPGS